MTATKNSIAQHQKMQLERAQYINSTIEARQAKVKSVAFRRDILEKQRVNNYSSEYNRIRAHLSDTAIPAATRAGIKTRTELLKSMGARAVEM